MAAKRSRKAKPRQNLAEKLAAQILEPIVAARGEHVMVDVANHTTADMRDAESLKRTQTPRRKSRVERLASARIISPHHQRALQWYLDQYEEGYLRGLKVTANHEATGGGGYSAYDLCATNKKQAEARKNFLWARAFIRESLIEGFEHVVLGQGNLCEVPVIGDSERTRFRNRRAAFLLACNLLHTGINHVTG